MGWDVGSDDLFGLLNENYCDVDLHTCTVLYCVLVLLVLFNVLNTIQSTKLSPF